MVMKNFDRNRAVTGRERLAHLDMFFRGAVGCAHSGTARVSKRPSAKSYGITFS
jgi:hypothetical protein